MRMLSPLFRRVLLQQQKQRLPTLTSHRLVRALSSNVVITKTKPEDLTTQPTNTTNTTNNPSQNHPDTTQSSTTNDQVQITNSCWNRIHKLVTSKGNPNLYLRVFVDAGGCSGFSYQFELDDAALESDDVVFESSPTGSRLVIDEASLEMLRGSTIDYVQEMIKSSFQVTNNPQSESACGCGSSFALKNFAVNPAID